MVLLTVANFGGRHIGLSGPAETLIAGRGATEAAIPKTGPSALAVLRRHWYAAHHYGSGVPISLQRTWPIGWRPEARGRNHAAGKMSEPLRKCVSQLL
jgi:hypothetical protein